MEGRLGNVFLPPSSAKPGLVMNKPAVAGACVRCARPSLTLLALRNTRARSRCRLLEGFAVGVSWLRVACAGMCAVISLKSAPTNQELCFRKHNVRFCPDRDPAFKVQCRDLRTD